MKSPRANRRQFLHASMGALALPLLDSLRADAASEVKPKRLVLVYTPNGTSPEAWFPTPGGDPSGFALGAIHQPLADYKDRLVILRGVHNAVAQDPLNNGGPHQRGIGALFTGQMLGTGEFKDGCGSSAGWAAGRSIDQEVAALVGQETLLASLELGVRCMDNDVQGRISYAAPGVPLPPINEPVATYDRLFLRDLPTTPSANLRGESILSAVGDQFSALRPRLGQADREKLDGHLALVEDLERRMGFGQGGTCAQPIPPPSALVADSEDTMPEVSRLQLDMLAVAFACDLTRVASVQYSTGFNRLRYPWLESFEEGHALSHSGDSDVAAWSNLAARQAWHAGELAYLMQRLDAIPEGDGTVLDNTLIVWGTEVSKGNSHSLDDIPYLLAGTAGGALISGQFLELGGISNSRLLLTILRAYGFAGDTFGHPDYDGDEIPGLLA
jgi:hypothetical protein